MKRHSTRKKLTAHGRGEHRGLNLLFARGGCPACAADVLDLRRHTIETIEATAKALLAEQGLTPEEIDSRVELATERARAEGFI